MGRRAIINSFRRQTESAQNPVGPLPGGKTACRRIEFYNQAGSLQHFCSFRVGWVLPCRRLQLLPGLGVVFHLECGFAGPGQCRL